MTLAALKSFADQYPNDRITLLSRPVAKLLMEGLPSNVSLRTVNLNNYTGLGGLRRLSRELLKEDYDVLVDWHDVLRSKVIRFFFRKARHKVAVIDKGRKERRAITRQKDKVLKPLTPSPERYALVLEAAGFPIELKPYRMFGDTKADIADLADITGAKGSDPWVGIAPFAAHEGKVYPPRLMEQVIFRLIQQYPNGRIFLFGRGEEEEKFFQLWCAQYRQCTSVAKHCEGMYQELILMSHLNVMLSMDSANMHLASLTGVPVVSVWGATHPMAGFLGYNQDPENAIQIDLECRPCSIYGNKPCQRGDYACLQNIPPERIVDRIVTLINN